MGELLPGDLILTDSPMGDYLSGFPTAFDSRGQINAYQITVAGFERVHFDAFDHTIMSVGNGKTKEHQWVAPFSHDSSHDGGGGSPGGGVIPEPGTLLLLGTGLVGIGAAARRRGRKMNR